jgi:hypothetical protein
MYVTKPQSAVMPPGSTQRIVVKMTPKKKEQEDGQYEDVLRIYSGLAREGVEASDFVNRIYYEVCKEFQIVYTKKVISFQGSDCALVNFFYLLAFQHFSSYSCFEKTAFCHVIYFADKPMHLRRVDRV